MWPFDSKPKTPRQQHEEEIGTIVEMVDLKPLEDAIAAHDVAGTSKALEKKIDTIRSSVLGDGFLGIDALNVVDGIATTLSFLGIGGALTKGLSQLNELSDPDQIAQFLVDEQVKGEQIAAAQSSPKAPMVEDVSGHSAPPATGMRPQTTRSNVRTT
jgi:hypothetical protein